MIFKKKKGNNLLIIFKNRAIPIEEAEKLKKNYNIHLFMEASAKNGFNVENMFCEAAKLLYEEYQQDKSSQIESKVK